MRKYILIILLTICSFSILVFGQNDDPYLDGKTVINDIINKNVSFYSVDTLFASVLITEGSEVLFTAGTSIKLNKGVKVDKENSFHAVLGIYEKVEQNKRIEDLNCNYSNGSLKISNSCNLQKVKSYSIYNLVGQIIDSGDFTGSSVQVGLHPGVYIIRIQLGCK